MLILLSLFCTLIQDEPVFPGPQPGEKLVPFVATGVLGKDADQKLDVVTETDKKPCVLIFPKQIRLGISVDGKEGPGAYGLNRNVA